MWWRTAAAALEAERALKAAIGWQDVIRKECHDADPLRRALIEAAGADSWEAGYIEAIFDVGEDFQRLLSPRFSSIWAVVGVPPGPWSEARRR